MDVLEHGSRCIRRPRRPILVTAGALAVAAGATTAAVALSRSGPAREVVVASPSLVTAESVARQLDLRSGEVDLPFALLRAAGQRIRFHGVAAVPRLRLIAVTVDGVGLTASRLGGVRLTRPQPMSRAHPAWITVRFRVEGSCQPLAGRDVAIVVDDGGRIRQATSGVPLLVSVHSGVLGVYLGAQKGRFVVICSAFG